MIVLVEKVVKEKNTKELKNVFHRIYINTLIPYFNFKNKDGKIIYKNHFCAKL